MDGLNWLICHIRCLAGCVLCMCDLMIHPNGPDGCNAMLAVISLICSNLAFYWMNELISIQKWRKFVINQHEITLHTYIDACISLHNKIFFLPNYEKWMGIIRLLLWVPYDSVVNWWNGGDGMGRPKVLIELNICFIIITRIRAEPRVAAAGLSYKWFHIT